MATAQRRITERPREYEGEKEAASLVNWLNTTQDTAAKNRIIEILGLFMLLANHEAGKGREAAPSGVGEKSVTSASLTKARDHVERRLDRALRYYTMRPKIYIFGGGSKAFGPSLIVGWEPISGSKLYRHSKAHYVSPLDVPWEGDDDPLLGTQMGESGAIKTALELMESGAIFQVELCRCGRFFYKRFSHQKFCTSKCRLAEFRESDESRRKRNEYARKLYHLHKRLDTGK